jgi:hypothetical protein
MEKKFNQNCFPFFASLAVVCISHRSLENCGCHHYGVVFFVMIMCGNKEEAPGFTVARMMHNAELLLFVGFVVRGGLR